MDKEQEAKLAQQLQKQREGAEAPEKEIEDSSLKSEDQEEVAVETDSESPQETPETTESDVEQAPSAEQIDWTESAKSEGWISPDEKESYIKVDEDPFIAKMYELKKQGINIEDPNFIAEQTIDYSSFDAEDPNQALTLIKKELQANNPDASSEDIDWMVEKEYGAINESQPVQGELEDDDDFQKRMSDYNRRKKDAQISSKFAARNAKKFLSERQEKMRLPQTPQQPQISQEEIEAHRKNLASEASEALKGLNEIKVTVGDKDYSLDTSEMLKDVKKTMLNDVVFENTYFSKYVNDDKISYANLAEDLLWANEETRNKLIGAAVNQALSQGEENVAKAIKNTELPTKPSAPQKERPQLEGADLLAYQIAQRRAKG